MKLIARIDTHADTRVAGMTQIKSILTAAPEALRPNTET